MIKQTVNLITRLANFALENPASFLKRSAAVNFSMGSVGLIIGMLINDKIPAKEKRFMIVQEGVEGVLDLGVFLGVASAFEKAGRWLIQTKKLVPSIEGLTRPQVEKAITAIFKNFDNPVGVSIAAESGIKTCIKATEVGAGLLGTIIAFNIITPLIRNFFASKIESALGKKMDRKNSIAPILPAAKMGNAIKYDKTNPFAAFEQATNIARLPVRTTFTGSGMRI